MNSSARMLRPGGPGDRPKGLSVQRFLAAAVWSSSAFSLRAVCLCGELPGAAMAGCLASS